VASGAYPAPEHVVSIKDEEMDKFLAGVNGNPMVSSAPITG
jgi:hypothetical protein